ncbi:hypothetical protein RhiirA4_540352 [Rhizophagus irregularis]|uniref:Protein kinase domain-containing protein n=1 Tax=Rhizophagus irregularis TaxID=588596 RepID=A0A2I1G6X6_9GLOM|nr:hypothetical protein RhiirA4_540352 [Rhizophagus irregularis]
MEILKNIEIIGRGVLKAGWLKNHRKVDHHKNIIRFYEISKGNYYLKGLNYSLTKNRSNTRQVFNDSQRCECLHEEGIIHRDLVMPDLGLSKQLAEMSHGINEIKGVVPYIDPQAFKNNEYKLDKKSDVYSVGVLFLEISSERPPFEKSTNKVSTMLSIVTGNREQPVTNT